MNWLLSLPSVFLQSKLSGWIAVAALSGVFGLWWYIDNLQDKYRELQVECLVKSSPEIQALADDLKNRNTQEYDALRDLLDDAEHPCLDWVYDPSSPARENPSLRNPEAGE